MNAKNFAHEAHHLLSESAMHLVAKRCGALAVLLRLAGTSPLGCRALPDRHSAALSGASCCGF